MFSSVAHPPRVQPQAVVASRPAGFGNREHIQNIKAILQTLETTAPEALKALKDLTLKQTPIPEEHKPTLADAGLIFPQGHKQPYTMKLGVKTAIHELYAASHR
jgi:hypothetical protein